MRAKANTSPLIGQEIAASRFNHSSRGFTLQLLMGMGTVPCQQHLNWTSAGALITPVDCAPIRSDGPDARSADKWPVCPLAKLTLLCESPLINT